MAALHLNLPDLLPAFLREAAAAPHRFGHWDCCMFPANWLRAATGVDPAADLRGAYGDEAGWRAIVGRYGAVAAMMGRLVAPLGLARLAPDAAPAAGDVAAVYVRGLCHAGAIFTGGGWALKLNDGLTRLPCRPLASWRL